MAVSSLLLLFRVAVSVAGSAQALALAGGKGAPWGHLGDQASQDGERPRVGCPHAMAACANEKESTERSKRKPDSQEQEDSFGGSVHALGLEHGEALCGDAS